MQSLLENSGIRDAVLRLDVERYHRLCSSGIIPERTELLEGVVVEKLGKSPLHTWTVAFLEDWFRRNLRSDLCLRVEQPLTLGTSEPEPDIAIVSGHRDHYRNQHPTSALLVAEVAITTTDLDQAKAAIYAHAAIPRYLLILPERAQVIVFEDIQSEVYQTRRVISGSDAISISELCDESLPLSLLFPA